MKTKLLLVMFVAASFCCDAAFSQSSTDEIKRLLTRAQTAYGMQNYEDALNEYLKIKQMAPNYPDLYKAIGDVYEKLGKGDDLKNAIESYKTYLRLVPHAMDKEDVNKKIYALEYVIETIEDKEKMLDDFSGIWISDIKNDKGLPAFLFRITEMGKTGKFRVEMLPESQFYSETIIQKIVNAEPDKKNNLSFVFADAQVYNPSNAKYSFWSVILNTGLGMAGTSQFTQSMANVGLEMAREKDLPKSTQTAYAFDVQYSNGELKGSCIIKQMHNNSKTNTEKQNDYFEIILKKDAALYTDLTSTLRIKGGEVINKTGRSLKLNDVENIMKDYPDLLKRYKSGLRTEKAGVVFVGIGGGLMLGSLIGLIVIADTADDTAISTTGSIIGAGGATMALGGLIIWGGSGKKRSAIRRYNNIIKSNQTSYNFNFGITPSGVGLVVNF